MECRCVICGKTAAGTTGVLGIVCIEHLSQLRGLSVRQPWAGFLALEDKKSIETRTWATAFRGYVLICAGKAIDTDWRKVSSRPNADAMRPACCLLGQSVCLRRLVDCRPMVRADEDASMVRFRPALFSWVFSRRIYQFEPFDAKGKQGLFRFDSQSLTA